MLTNERGSQRVTPRVRSHKLLGILAFIIVLTRAPGLLLAMQKTFLANEQTGFVAVLFPPSLSAHAVFDKTLRAGGSMIRRTWLPNLWIVHSSQPEFVGRLKTQGAWFAADPAIFELSGWIGCVQIVDR